MRMRMRKPRDLWQEELDLHDAIAESTAAEIADQQFGES